MDIFDILTLIGGLCLFLFGMNVMGDGLERRAGGGLKLLLGKLTNNRMKGFLTGLGVTAVIQSSSATTVMVVGFVNSGLMTLKQSIGVIMGANIGTTVTAWILSLGGISSSNVFVQLLKPTSFTPVLALIGMILLMTGKTDKKKDTGTILLGFATLMFGMDTMSGAVAGLADVPAFRNMFIMFKNPLFGMLAGAVLTAIIQSSSASVGILQALTVTGQVSYGAAIPIIMGQNIGTCVTALISSIGASKNAKRASMIHLYFNLIGTILFMVAFYSINAAIGGFDFLNDPANAAGIAVVHSLFNIGAVLVLYPFGDKLVKLAQITIPDHAGESEEAPNELAILDERFLEKPAFAMELCRNAAVRMAQEARDALHLALDNVTMYSESRVAKIIEMEESVDRYEDALGTYLVKLNNCDLSQKDSRTLSILLHCIGNFERISDHAVNLTDSTTQMHEKKLEFSKKAIEELQVFSDALRDIVDQTMEAFALGDLDKARQIEPFEQVIDSLNIELKQRHIRRLRKGKCTIELGLILEDMITNYERISDHCSNIAVCMIRVNEDGFDTHEYLDVLKEEKAPWFEEEFYNLSKKYALPEKKSAKNA